MSNTSLDILKTFTRKLANCRYKVKLNTVIDYMNDGKFGYTTEDGIESVITNDLVFADDIATVITHLKAIFKEPHIFLKKEEIVQNVSVANKMDNETIRMNYQDAKLWRIKDGETALEYAHAFVHEDNLAIYENRFICALIDVLFDTLNKKLNELCETLEFLNFKITGQNFALNPRQYIAYSDECDGLPVLLTSKTPSVIAINSLIKSKKELMALKSRDLYKACKKARPFNLLQLKPTNILNHDKEYNYCYLFYINYLNKDPIITTERKMYVGYTQVNFFTALKDLGFIPNLETQEILVSNSANLKFEKLEFIKEPFVITLTMRMEDEINMRVSETVDGNFADYVFKIANQSAKANIPEFTTPNEYAKFLNEDKTEDIYNVFLVTDVEQEGASADNVVNLLPDKSDTIEKIKFAVKTCLITIEGAMSIHTRYCPVCGSRLIAPNGLEYVCTACEAVWHVFGYSLKDIIWLKRLPKVELLTAENVGINTNNEPEIREMVNETIAATTVEEPAVEETPAEENTPTEENAPAEEASENTDGVATADGEETTSVKKSFYAKMCLADDEEKDLYNKFKQYVMGYKKVSSRLSWNSDTFSSGRLPKIKLTMRGKTLVAFFALNPSDYLDSKYYVHDMSEVKKYEATPMMIKIKSERGLKHAIELADVLFSELPKKKDYVAEEYIFPAKTEEELIAEGQAKIVTININI